MSPVLKHLFVQIHLFVSESCSGDVSIFFICAFTTRMVALTSTGPGIMSGAVFSRLLLVSEAFQGVSEFGVGCSNIFSQLCIRVCECRGVFWLDVATLANSAMAARASAFSGIVSSCVILA